MEGQEKHENARKAGLFLIIIGLIIGLAGAAVSFIWGSPVVFYLGFVIAIAGFAVAILSRF
jgi:hypothetical protein